MKKANVIGLIGAYVATMSCVYATSYMLGKVIRKSISVLTKSILSLNEQ